MELESATGKLNAYFDGRQPEIMGMIERLVNMDSFSEDGEDVNKVGETVSGWMREAGFHTEKIAKPAIDPDELPGRADERTAGQILLLPRPLADKHQRRMQVALAEHHVRPRLTKPAFFAGKNRFRERWPRCVHAVRLPFSLSMPF